MTTLAFCNLTSSAAVLAAALIAALPASVPGGGPAYAGPPSSGPDWPCPQRKVLQLSASDLQWEGDITEAATGWRQQPGLTKLVERVASRRVSKDDAVAAIKADIDAVPPADRKARLTRIFAGLLETVNLYRGSVIDGIERFTRRQRSRAEEIEREGLTLAELRKAAETDPAKRDAYEKANELYDWNVRVFEERRQNLPVACDIPPAIDGRTFEIVRELRAMVKAAG